MTVDEIATYLGTVSPTLGLIIKGTMPATPNVCLSIMESGGSPSDLGFSNVGIRYEHPSIQIMTRGEVDDYETPRATIERAYREMAKIQAMTLSGTKYLIVKPMQAPYLFARDDSKRVRFVCNFTIDKELS